MHNALLETKRNCSIVLQFETLDRSTQMLLLAQDANNENC